MALNLPPLPAGQPIATKDGLPSLAFTVYWQQLLEALAGAINEISDNVAAIQAAMDAAAAAQATANTATVIASARQPDVAPITVTADSSGAVHSGQLPRNVSFKRYSLNSDVTATAGWSATLLAGAATFSMGAATGVLSITALSASSTIQVQSVKDGVTLTSILVVYKSNAAAGGGSGGGGSTSDSSFVTFNSATHAPVSDVLEVAAGAGGIVTLTAADLVVSTGPIGPQGGYDVYGKWEWDSTGAGAWVDVGTEDLNTVAVQVFDLGDGSFGYDPGALTSNEVKTGLTPSALYKFRFSARNNSGTRTMSLAGTVSAVGS